MKYLLFTVLLIAFFLPAQAQNKKKLLRDGNREYSKSGFNDSELSYRKAIDIDPAYLDAEFNLGDALYRQDKFEEANEKFKKLSSNELKNNNRAEAYYNLGNSFLKSNKLEEGIEAYKDALRLDPSNLEAKHNLAYAQDQLQQQQQQDQDDKKDQNDNQENKEDDPSSQDQQDQEKQDDNKEEKSQDQQEQESEQRMSKEDAERLLQALAADEKEVQEKVKKAKAAKQKIRTLKEW